MSLLCAIGPALGTRSDEVTNKIYCDGKRKQHFKGNLRAQFIMLYTLNSLVYYIYHLKGKDVRVFWLVNVFFSFYGLAKMRQLVVKLMYKNVLSTCIFKMIESWSKFLGGFLCLIYPLLYNLVPGVHSPSYNGNKNL